MNSVSQHYKLRNVYTLPSISPDVHIPARRRKSRSNSACFKKVVILQKLED